MDNQRTEHIVEAAQFLNGILRKIVADEHGIHAETIIAAAGRMAGTMLYRSFGFPTMDIAAGTKVFSEQANVVGPKVMNVMLVTLRQLGHNIREQTVIEDQRNSKHLTFAAVAAGNLAMP